MSGQGGSSLVGCSRSERPLAGSLEPGRLESDPSMA